MISYRLKYFALVLIVLTLGIFSRKVTYIPFLIGDILYACLIYFGIRFIYPNLSTNHTALLTVLYCFAIEFMQLNQSVWLKNIRNTTLGHYILGQGFLLTDLLCYLIGVFISRKLDRSKITKTRNSL
jgi:Protein of unknown function (DUF2809)